MTTMDMGELAERLYEINNEDPFERPLPPFSYKSLYSSKKADRLDLQGRIVRMREFINKAGEEEIAEVLAQCVEHENKESYEILEAALLVALQYYGRRKKADGARSFAGLVKEMRRNQKLYFQSRSRESLADSKRLEQQVDKSIEAVEKYQVKEQEV